jgi:hypothetical protein
MSKHTPGPWEFDGQSYIWSDMAIGKMIAQIRGWGWLQKEGEEEAIAEQEANARLIAAAPEMYEALKKIIEEISTDSPLTVQTVVGLLDVIHAALAKAEVGA